MAPPRLKNGRFTKRRNDTKNGEVECEMDTGRIEWCDGRRIVNLKLLANRLEECSNNLCKRPLRLIDVTSEINVGLASLLYINCECGHVNRVPTDTTHCTETYDTYDVNTKLAEAILDCGISFHALQKLLSILGIPYPSRALVKRREREIGPKIEEVARASCLESRSTELAQVVRRLWKPI